MKNGSRKFGVVRACCDDRVNRASPSIQRLVPLLMVSLMVLLAVKSSFSQSLGKTYPLRSREAGKGAVYAFVDESSCFVCNKHLHSLKLQAAKASVPFVLFVLGADEKRTRELIDRDFGADSSFVYDEFYVYDAVFELEQVPMLLVLDKSGRLLFKGIPGKVMFDDDEFISRLKDVATQDAQAFRYSLKGVPAMEVESVVKIPKEYSINTSIALSGAYSKRKNNYVVLNHYSKQMLQVEADGSCHLLPPLKSYHLPYTPATSMIKGRSDDGESIVLWDTDLRCAKPWIVQLHPTDTTYKVEQLPDDWTRLNRRIEYLGDSLPIVITKRIDDGFDPYLSDTTMLFYGRGAYWQSLGRRDPMFYDSILAKYSWLTVAAYDTLLLIYQNLTSYIDEYTTNGAHRRRLSIDFPDSITTQINPAFEELNGEATSSNKTSGIIVSLLANQIFADSHSSIACLTLAFKVASLKEPVPGESHSSYQGVALFIDLEKWKQIGLWQFPIGYSPFQFADGRVRRFLVDHGRISIATILIPNFE